MLKVENLWAGYKGLPVLKGASLSVNGEKAVLLGPNGSGKTTLIKAILGLIDIMDGSIEVFGRRVEDVRGETRLSTNYPLAYSLFPISVRDLIDLYMHVKGGDVDYAHTLIRNLKLEGVLDKKLHQLSAGQRTLVCNVLAIASRPELLILDEPFEQVDPARVRMLVRVLQDYEGELLMITHQLPVLEHFPDHTLYMIFDGRVYGPLKPLRRVLDAYIHLKKVESPLLTVEVGGRSVYLSEEPGDYKLRSFMDMTTIYEVLI